MPLHADQLDLLRFAAELYLSTGTKLQLKLPRRMRDAQDKLVASDDPALRVQQRWLEIYLALLGAKTSAAPRSTARTRRRRLGR